MIIYPELMYLLILLIHQVFTRILSEHLVIHSDLIANDIRIPDDIIPNFAE